MSTVTKDDDGWIEAAPAKEAPKDAPAGELRCVLIDTRPLIHCHRRQGC